MHTHKDENLATLPITQNINKERPIKGFLLYSIQIAKPFLLCKSKKKKKTIYILD